MENKIITYDEFRKINLLRLLIELCEEDEIGLECTSCGKSKVYRFNNFLKVILEAVKKPGVEINLYDEGVKNG